MSRQVDTRVVEMKFDNREFERNMQETLTSLDQLDEKLKFDGVEEGFEEISKASQRVKLGALGDAIDSVKIKFNALEVAALTVLTNITNKAVNAGERLLKAFTVDNISSGWQKFGDITTSVGTMVSQGYKLQDVEKVIDQLSWFSDETSYSLTDMIDNLSKFTAAGHQLEPAAHAMEGIALWAAKSGVNASKASRAMYQLSQASARSIQLIDWRSIQTLNMDNQEFRRIALEAAKTNGTIKEVREGIYETLKGHQFTIDQFTEYLSDNWFNKKTQLDAYNAYSTAIDRLYEYARTNSVTASQAIHDLGMELDQFGVKAFKAGQEARTWTDVVNSVKDAVSTGWATTFQQIFGNYEEATRLFTALANMLYDAFAESGNERNALLKEWKAEGGRLKLLDALAAGYYGLADAIGAVKEAFRDIFPEKTSADLLRVTDNFRKFMYWIKLSEPELESLKSLFRGVFGLIRDSREIFTAVIKAIFPSMRTINSFRELIFRLIGTLGESLEKLHAWIEETGIAEIVFNNLRKVVDLVVKAFDYAGIAFDFLKGKIKDFLKSLENLTPIVAGAGGIATILVSLYGVFTLMNNTLFRIFSIVMGTKGFIGGILDLFGSVVASLEKIKKTLSMKLIGETIKTVLYVVGSIGILAVSIYALSKIETKDLWKAMAAIGVLTAVVMGIAVSLSVISMKTNVLTKIWQKMNSVGVIKLSASILLVVNAMAMLARTLIKLKDLSWAEIIKGSAGIVALGAFVVTLLRVMQKISSVKTNFKFGAGIIASAASLFFTSGAIWLLARAITDISKLSIIEIAKGGTVVVALGVFLEILNNMAHKASNIGAGIFGSGLFASATSLLLTSASIALLAKVIKDISQLSTTEIIKGGTVVVVLGIFIEILNDLQHKSSLINPGKGLIKSSVGLILTAEAVKMLAQIAIDISKLSVIEIAKGVGTVVILGTFLEALNKWMHKMSILEEGKKFGSFLKPSGALILTSAAIAILAAVAKNISELSLVELAKGIGAIALLGTFVEALNYFNHKFSTMENVTGLIKSSISLTIMSASILLLAGIAKKLSELTLPELARGIGALAILELFLIALQKFTRIGSFDYFAPWQTLVSSGSIMILSLGISLLAKTAKDLATAEGDLYNGITALGVLTLFTIGLSKAVQMVGNISLINIPGMLAGVLGVIGLITTLSLAVPAFEKLSKINGVSLLLAGMAASTIIAAMTIVVTKLGELELANVVGLIAGVVSVGAMLALINFLIVPAFEKLNKVEWGRTWLSVLNMIGIITAITGLTGIIGAITLGALPAVAAGLITLAAAMGVVASVIIPTIDSVNSLAVSLTELNGLVFSNPVSKIIDQVLKAAETLKNEAPNLKTKMEELGKYTVEGVVKGINNNIEKAKEAGKAIGLAIALGYVEQQIIESPADYMAGLSKYSVLGVVAGITNNIGLAEAAGRSLGQAVADGYRQTAVINISDDIVPKASGINNYDAAMKQQERASRDAGRQAVREQKEKENGFWSTLWKNIGFSASGGQARQNASQQTQAIKNTNTYLSAEDAMIKAQRDAEQAMKDAEKAAKEAYDQIGDNSDALKYYEQICNDFNVTMEGLTFDTDKYNDVAAQTSDILNNATGSATKAKSAFETLKDTISSQMDIFSEFNDATDISAQQMLDNMKSNIFGINSWANNLARLSMRGLNADLLKQLGDLGPQGYAKVAAFAQMTDEQLKEANFLYGAAMKLPGYAAEEVASSYQYAGEMAVKGYSNALDKFKGLMKGYEIGQVTLEDLTRALYENTEPVVIQARSTSSQVKTGLAYSTTREDGQEVMAPMIDGMVDEVVKLPEKVEAAMSEAYPAAMRIAERASRDAGRQAVRDAQENAQNTVIGTTSTFTSTWAQNEALKAMDSFTYYLNNRFKTNEQEHSPSKVWAGFGQNLILGLLEGMKTETANAIDSVISMTASINDAITGALNSAYQPTLTPILDLSEIQNGVTLDSVGTASVDLVAAGFNANMELVRQMHAQQIAMNTALQGAIEKQSEDLIAAIASTDKPVNVNVTLQGDASGLFRVIREQNNKFTKINGYNALA